MNLGKIFFKKKIKIQTGIEREKEKKEIGSKEKVQERKEKRKGKEKKERKEIRKETEKKAATKK